MQIERYTAPARWIAPLVNDDWSAITETQEAEMLAKFIARIYRGMTFQERRLTIIDVWSDTVGYTYWHDALNEYPFGAECVEYVVYKPGLPSLPGMNEGMHND